MNRFGALCLFSLVLGLWGAAAPERAPASASEDGAAPGVGRRDPAALAELRRATDFLSALPRFRLSATVAYDAIQADGRRIQFEKSGTLFLQRPDRFYGETRLDDGRQRRIWYDGKTLSIAELSKNVHARVKAPPTADAALDMLERLFREPLPLSDLLYSDLRPLERRATEAAVVGESTVDGRPCLHLAFRGEVVDWQLWVEQGPKPFVRKLVITYRKEAGTPQYTAWIDRWETPRRLQADLFRFKAPAGSQRIDLLVPLPRVTEEGGRP